MNNPDTETFKTWSAQIKQSNRNAFDELFRCLYPQLVYFAMQFTKQKASACDIVQDSFVILWNKREGIDPEQSLKAFMFKIVRNRSINWLKKSDNNHQDLEDHLQSISSTRNDEIESPETLSSHFKNWISELPERQREAFELSRFDGLDHHEIAGVMGVSPKTVNNHIVTALNTLRDQYDHYRKRGNYEQ